MRIFTWHIHGSYLYYLSQGNFEIYIPVNEARSEGYYGRGETFAFGRNVIEVPASEVRNMDFDLVLFQSHKNYLIDQYEILTEQQRGLPRIAIEHDPPLASPTDTLHPVGDPEVLVVHVSFYNQLMWHNAGPTQVIEHGVTGPEVTFTGELQKGVVVVNHLMERGRRLGGDIFHEVSTEIPLDLIGMGTDKYGGLGEVLYHDLPDFISRYRFFFNPIRYTSLGLAVLEAMRLSMPLVCLSTTEYSTVIQNGVNGFIHTDVDYLKKKMRLLLEDRDLAVQLGRQGRETVAQRYNIDRFTKDWEETFNKQIHKHSGYEQTHRNYQ